MNQAHVRATVADIDLGAIVHNLEVLSRLEGTPTVYPVIKANAYGHGLVPVARALEAAGAKGLCVALVEEGLKLRAAGTQLPIVVLNGCYGEFAPEMLAARLTPTIHGLDQLRVLARAAEGRVVRYHLKVDTGMHRLGLPLERLEELVEELRHHSNLELEGVMTHLASADEDRRQTLDQLAVFDRAIDVVRKAGHRPTWLHASNSAGALLHPDARYNLIRPGIAMYGISPVDSQSFGLRPALRLSSRVVTVRTVRRGDAVGYNATFVARSPIRIATVPIGYGDGLLRSASNSAEALIRGRRCRFAGRVSMDLITLDVTHVDGADVGDEVVLIGRQGSDEITSSELARAAGTISYEVVTGLLERVPRRYRPQSSDS